MWSLSWNLQHFFVFFFCIIRGYVLSCFTESANLVACEKAPGSSFRRENHLLIPLKRGCSFRFEIYLVFYIVPRPSDRHDTQSCQLGGEKKPAKIHLAENGDARARSRNPGKRSGWGWVVTFDCGLMSQPGWRGWVYSSYREATTCNFGWFRMSIEWAQRNVKLKV